MPPLTPRVAQPASGVGAHADARTRFVDPVVLARIGNLDLLARGVVDGFVSGLHRTLSKGLSSDFAEHRAYVPGDDVRHIDWRLFARTERLHVKTYEAETNADLVLLLDSSASMDWTSAQLSKFDYARMVLASLAHLGARQRDRIGLATFADSLLDWLPPGAGRRDACVMRLSQAEPQPASDLARALERLTALLTRRGIVVIVSDFYVEADVALRALGGLRARGHDVIAMQVLDPGERNLELSGAQVLRDLESGDRMPVVAEEVRGRYRELFEAHIKALADGCAARDIDFVTLDTTEALDHALFAFLSARRHRHQRGPLHAAPRGGP